MAAIQPGHGAGSGCSDLTVRPPGTEACVSMTTTFPDRQQQVSLVVATSSPICKDVRLYFDAPYSFMTDRSLFVSLRLHRARPRPRKSLRKSPSEAGATRLRAGRLRTGKEQQTPEGLGLRLKCVSLRCVQFSEPRICGDG